MYECPRFIILADFNARISNKDTLPCITSDNIIGSHEYDIPRRSKDNIINTEDGKLLEFCNNCNLKILNGNYFNDTEGNYTYIHPQGSSTIDFALVSENSIELLTDFNIINATTSSHNGLSLTLKHDFHNNQHTPLNWIPVGTHTTNLKWLESSSQSFKNNISDSIGKLYQIGINNFTYHNDIQSAINLLYDSIINSSHNMLKYSINTVTHNRTKHWYDTECRETKASLNKALKNYKRISNLLNRNTYITIRKNYKQLLETKRNNYTTEESNKLNSWLNQKQDKKIWDYIKTLKNYNAFTKQLIFQYGCAVSVLLP